MLVLRWTGPDGEEDAALTLLMQAAARVPHMPATEAELVAYQRSLPLGVYVIALPAECILGPWTLDGAAS